MAPRIVLCWAALLALAGCAADELVAAPVVQLTVRVDPDGRGAEPAREAVVSCTKPHRTGPCAAAARLRPADFEPVPGDVACTELFGGPQTATVTGTLDGHRVDARF